MTAFSHTLSLRRALFLSAIYLLTLTVFLTACLAADPAPTSAPATQKAGGFAPAFAAIAYYDDSCRRCHGPQGSFYGPDLGKGLTDKQLIKIVDDMANGPGQSPLTEEQLAVETAFHRALISGTPYLSVTGIEVNKISGEVMPEAKVLLSLNGKSIEAKVENSTWSATIPADAKPADITITADIKGKTTTLALAKSPAFSHTTPVSLPPADTQPAKSH